MNQRAFVEFEIIKNDMPYRIFLPMGAPFSDAHQVLLDAAQGVLLLQKTLEEQARMKEEAEAKAESLS